MRSKWWVIGGVLLLAILVLAAGSAVAGEITAGDFPDRGQGLLTWMNIVGFEDRVIGAHTLSGFDITIDGTYDGVPIVGGEHKAEMYMMGMWFPADWQPGFASDDTYTSTAPEDIPGENSLAYVFYVTQTHGEDNKYIIEVLIRFKNGIRMRHTSTVTLPGVASFGSVDLITTTDGLGGLEIREHTMSGAHTCNNVLNFGAGDSHGYLSSDLTASSYFYLVLPSSSRFITDSQGFRVEALTIGVAPSEVWVDDDYTEGSCGGHTWGYDAFATIQEGINAVAGSTVNVAAGTYREYLHITKDGLTVQGAGIDQSIIDLDGLKPYWHYQGCSTSYGSRAGVLISGYGSPDEIIEDVTFKGFTVKNAGLNPPIPYTEFYDDNGDGWDDMRGINIANGKNVTIEDCKVTDCGYGGINTGYARCVSTHKYSEGITINNCIVTDHPWAGINIGNNVGSFTVTNNVCENIGQPHYSDPTREYMGYGIRVSGKSSSLTTGGLIAGNTCSNNGFEGIIVTKYTDGVTVENNTVTGHNSDQDGAGIFLYHWGNPDGCRNHLIRNNTVTGNIRGIVAYYAQESIIEGNTITTDAGAFPQGQGGIKLDNANNITVRNNTVSCDGTGITVMSYDATHNSHTNTFTGNTISGAKFAGVLIYGPYARDNTFTGNTITDTTTLTLWAGETYEETQGDGVFIDDDASTGNVFHYNNIHDNAGDGMENQTTTEVDAENNNWGSPTGPYHPTKNPTGLGDSVSDNVDFEPWFGAETGTVVEDPALVPGETLENVAAGVSVQNTGTGTTGVIIAEYTAPPAGTPSFGAGATYVDVQLSDPGNVNELTITFTGMAAGTVIYFYLPGTGWIACSHQVQVGGTITVTITDSTVPTLAQLTGTIFAEGTALGNVNGDDVIDVLDVRLCLQIATGFLEGTGAQRASADVDGDGDVDLDDAQYLAEYIVGIITALPGGG